MRRASQIAIAAVAGAAAFAYGMKRIFGEKHFRTRPYGYGRKVQRAITVNRPAAEMYRYWRNLDNVMKLAGNIISIRTIDSTRSHWTMNAPGNFTLEWTAEITVDRPNEMIGWRSVGRAGMDNAGYIRFEPESSGRATVVRVALRYNPPAGKIGVVLSTIMGGNPAARIENALGKFKNVMEASPSSSVDTASEDSFPASDAPAWTGTNGR